MCFRELLGRLAAEHEELQVRYDHVIAENNNLRFRVSCIATEKETEAHVRQFEQEAEHMAPSPALGSEEQMLLRRHQREFRLRTCFLIKDEDLRFMRPNQFDLDSAMHEMERRQRAEQRLGIFRDRLAKSRVQRKRSRTLVMHPAGSRRLAWDLVSVFMFVYD